MHGGLLHGSAPTHSAPMTVPPPAQYYRITASPSRHVPSSIPSCSSTQLRTVILRDLLGCRIFGLEALHLVLHICPRQCIHHHLLCSQETKIILGEIYLVPVRKGVRFLNIITLLNFSLLYYYAL